MERPKKTVILLFIIIIILQCGCIDKYNSPYQSPTTGYLVVEGYITGNGPTQFTLSRTIPLPGDAALPIETGASVQVEGNDNSVYPLAEQNPGVYGIDAMPLNAATQYRLRINTSEGEQYLSAYVQYKPTPPIDSVNWTDGSGGVTIYVNTHDPANDTRYYQWTYTETWEYHSASESAAIYDTAANTVVPRQTAQDFYTCWKGDNSSSIILGSTIKLSEDVISEQPVQTIAAGSQQLGVEYSILVRQFALTQGGYNFLLQMLQNTESLGSIFDPTPSQLTGNIQCLTHPNEPVVGWVSAGTMQQQRIFINANQVPGWDYIYSCPEPDKVVPLDSLAWYFGGHGFVPIAAANPSFAGFIANQAGCLDCLLQGGTTTPPSFWPN